MQTVLHFLDGESNILVEHSFACIFTAVKFKVQLDTFL